MTLRWLLPGVTGAERARIYNLGRHREASARRPRPDPRRPAVVLARQVGGAVVITLPTHLRRALGWRRRDYLHVALSPDGRGLVVRHFFRA
jgi:hypothetical protein